MANYIDTPGGRYNKKTGSFTTTGGKTYARGEAGEHKFKPRKKKKKSPLLGYGRVHADKYKDVLED